MNTLVKQVVLGIVRHLATALGGYLAAKGSIAGSDAEQLTGAIMVIGGIGWSAWEKKKSDKGTTGNAGVLPGGVQKLLVFGLGSLLAVASLRAQEDESIITPLPVLVPESGEQSRLAWEFFWQNVDSLLTLTKRISVDAGMAAHFDKASELYASTGQSFTLISLRRGRWKWEALQWVHADTFFPEKTEDEIGLQTTLLRLPMPPPVTTVLEAPGRAITTATRNTVNVDSSFIAFDSFKIGARVFSATDAWFNGQIGSKTTGYAIFGSFDIGR